MNNEPHIKAVSLHRKYLISRPSLEALVSIITDQGYEIIDYDPESKSIAALSEKLSLTPAILNQNAFALCHGNVRLLFIRDSLKPEEKLYAMTHELGHIVLGHLRTGYPTSVMEEYEANEFTHYFLNPSPFQVGRLVVLRHRLATAAVVCVVILLAIGFGFIQYKLTAAKFIGDFYVTSSGTKYHKRECSVIQNKTNIRRITNEEFNDYEPCKLCLPDLQ